MSLIRRPITAANTPETAFKEAVTGVVSSENPAEIAVSAPKSLGLQDFSLQTTAKSTKLDIKTMSQAQLLDLKDQIEARLTGVDLAEVDLVQEMLYQLKRAKILQEEVNKPNSGVPANQKAQVQNSIGSILINLSKAQATTYNSEQFKKLEGALTKTLKDMPKEFRDAFYDAYGRELEAVATAVIQPEEALRMEAPGDDDLDDDEDDPQ